MYLIDLQELILEKQINFKLKGTDNPLIFSISSVQVNIGLTPEPKSPKAENGIQLTMVTIRTVIKVIAKIIFINFNELCLSLLNLPFTKVSINNNSILGYGFRIIFSSAFLHSFAFYFLCTDEMYVFFKFSAIQGGIFVVYFVLFKKTCQIITLDSSGTQAWSFPLLRFLKNRFPFSPFSIRPLSSLY